jgi:hypothetical protein
MALSASDGAESASAADIRLPQKTTASLERRRGDDLDPTVMASLRTGRQSRFRRVPFFGPGRVVKGTLSRRAD